MKLPFCSRSHFLTAFTRKLCISAVVPAFLPRLHDSFIFLQSFLLFYHVYTKALYFCSRSCFFSAFTQKLCIPAVVPAFFRVCTKALHSRQIRLPARLYPLAAAIDKAAVFHLYWKSPKEGRENGHPDLQALYAYRPAARRISLKTIT